MAFIWTEELENRAKHMWLAGDTGTAIALAIGAPSRSSVIGKMDRLGVKRPEIISIQNGRLGGKKNGGRKDQAPKPKKTPKPKVKFVCVNPWEDDMARKRLVDLGAHECKWPIGHVPEGMGHEQLFCARATVREDTYCPRHSKIASCGYGSAFTDKAIEYLSNRAAA